MKLTLPTYALTFPQLQRMRRQFIALHRQQSGGVGVMVGGDGGSGGGAGARASTAAKPSAAAAGKTTPAAAGSANRKMSEREKLARLFVAWLGDAFAG